MEIDLLYTFWGKCFIVNCICSILLVEWALSKLRPLHPNNKQVQIAAENYPEFKRNDLHKINRFAIYLSSPLIFIRFTIGWGGIAIVSTVVMIMDKFFHKKGDQKNTKKTRSL